MLLELNFLQREEETLPSVLWLDLILVVRKAVWNPVSVDMWRPDLLISTSLFLHIWLFCLPACVSGYHMHVVSAKARKGYPIPWDWSYSLWANMWMLGIKLRCSGRAAISPVYSKDFIQVDEIKWENKACKKGGPLAISVLSKGGDRVCILCPLRGLENYRDVGGNFVSIINWGKSCSNDVHSCSNDGKLILSDPVYARYCSWCFTSVLIPFSL